MDGSGGCWSSLAPAWFCFCCPIRCRSICVWGCRFRYVSSSRWCDIIPRSLLTLTSARYSTVAADSAKRLINNINGKQQTHSMLTFVQSSADSCIFFSGCTEINAPNTTSVIRRSQMRAKFADVEAIILRILLRKNIVVNGRPIGMSHLDIILVCFKGPFLDVRLIQVQLPVVCSGQPVCGFLCAPKTRMPPVGCG